MMTFKEAANMHKKYVCATYDQETQRKLREWCEDNFFDLTVQFNGEYQDPEDFEFHTTIFYTDNEVSDVHDGVYTLGVDYPVQVTGYELLGEKKDIPVLNVEGPMLRWIRENFEEKGFTDSWATSKRKGSLTLGLSGSPT